MSSEITLVLMIVAAVVVSAFVSWPLLTSKIREESDTADGESPLEELLVQKEATYTAIKELEFDHAMGNLSNRDYRELAKRYEDKAVALLKIIDETSETEQGAERLGYSTPPAVAGVEIGRPRHGRWEDEVERQVAAMRGGKRAVSGKRTAREDEEIERQVAMLRGAREESERFAPAPVSASTGPEKVTCPACGAGLKKASAAFCSHCGASLAAACPACGAPAEKGDRFCCSCGSPLTKGDGVAEARTAIGGANV